MRVLLTGGGTGGHIYPALAVARRLQEMESDVQLLYIGTDRGLESTIVPKEGIPFKSIEIEGFKRKLNFENIKYNFKSLSLFLKSIKEAKKIIQEFKPDVVLGTGGYVSAPICYAAAKENIPTIVHEQNSYLGLTNKFLIRYIDRLAISFEDIFEQTEKYKDKVIFTGNPRAQEVANYKKAESVGAIDEPTVLIFGGSRGAERINQAVVEAYSVLQTKAYQTILVTGEVHYQEVVKKLNEISPLKNHTKFVVEPYISHMIDVLQDVDVIVSRSGATTIAEITALGIPSILIPSPYVTADHQTKNAISLVSEQAAELLTESNLDGSSLVEKIDSLMMNDLHRKDMSEKSKKLGKPKATDELIQVMLSEIKKKNTK